MPIEGSFPMLVPPNIKVIYRSIQGVWLEGIMNGYGTYAWIVLSLILRAAQWRFK
jgi:hypothetical protein